MTLLIVKPNERCCLMSVDSACAILAPVFERKAVTEICFVFAVTDRRYGVLLVEPLR